MVDAYRDLIAWPTGAGGALLEAACYLANVDEFVRHQARARVTGNDAAAVIDMAAEAGILKDFWPTTQNELRAQ
jgi:hypothetical protein